jgi:hypothetical protein
VAKATGSPFSPKILANWGNAYFAAVRLGAVVVLILPDLPESDVRHILGEDAGEGPVHHVAAV